MGKYGERLLKGPGKGLSLLAFETSKKSRIMKKKMRISTLEKRLKEDLRDLGSLVYNDYEKGQKAVFEDEDVLALLGNIEKNRKELDFLREVIVRISRAKKVFRLPRGAAPSSPSIVEVESPVEDSPRIPPKEGQAVKKRKLNPFSKKTPKK
ncbi:hypothetical protein EPN96_06320 [bacterium]|nr:MAG: hypothetical protein EPN96_06320 [bacterium]